MGHKVHPKVYRIRKVEDWDTRGFYRRPAEFLEEDFRVRNFLEKKLGKIGIEKIEIERSPGKINVIISSARPGLIIGRGGEGVEKLKREMEEKILKKKTSFPRITGQKKEISKGKKISSVRPEGKKELRVEIREIRNPWTSAALTAQWIAQQIEKRIRHRRVMKQALGKVTANKDIKGARIEISGRLNGAEIARREWLAAGKLPRQTLRADIDYARERAHCTYGTVGIKVWLYKGERF